MSKNLSPLKKQAQLVKKGFKNVAKLTRKTTVLECFFNKVTRFRLQQRCFLVSFTKYFGKVFLKNISGG